MDQLRRVTAPLCLFIALVAAYAAIPAPASSSVTYDNSVAGGDSTRDALRRVLGLSGNLLFDGANLLPKHLNPPPLPHYPGAEPLPTTPADWKSMTNGLIN